SAFVVVSTSKLFSRPNFKSATFPFSMELWWNPAVLLKTNIRGFPVRFCWQELKKTKKINKTKMVGKKVLFMVNLFYYFFIEVDNDQAELIPALCLHGKGAIKFSP